MNIYTGSPHTKIEVSAGEAALLTLGLRTWLQVAGIALGRTPDTRAAYGMIKEFEAYLKIRRKEDEAREMDTDNVRDTRADGAGVSAEVNRALRRGGAGDSTSKEDGDGPQERGEGGGETGGGSDSGG